MAPGLPRTWGLNESILLGFPPSFIQFFAEFDSSMGLYDVVPLFQLPIPS